MIVYCLKTFFFSNTILTDQIDILMLLASYSLHEELYEIIANFLYKNCIKQNLININTEEKQTVVCEYLKWFCGTE